MITDDPNEPNLTKVDPETGMQEAYLVLAEEDLRRGFVRPVRRSYVHQTCGSVTRMGEAIAETYARDPGFYGGTYCARCRGHFPIGANGEFVWSVPRKDTPLGQSDKVGT